MRQICGEKLNEKNTKERLEEQYAKKFISNKDYQFVLKETTRLSAPGRRKQDVLERRILIKQLRDKHKLSFSQIGILLNRDHTSIIHSYYGE